MMSNKKQFVSLILLLALMVSSVSSVRAVNEKTDQSFVSDSLSDVDFYFKLYKSSFNSPDANPITGYAKIPSSTKFLAVDQAKIALDYLLLAEEAQHAGLTDLMNNYIQTSMATLKFLTSYLQNPLTRDRYGVIEFWDTALTDDGLTRVSKIARDQALTLLAIDKLLTFIDNGYSVQDSVYTSYLESFSNIWSFLQSIYDIQNGGWFTKTTTLNQTSFSIDKSKRTADNMIIISVLSEISVSHLSLLENGFTKAKLQTILDKSMNFFITKFLITDKGISSYGSFDGSNIVTDSFFAKENTLYGLSCLDLYKYTNNITYLTQAENIWSFLKTDMYEGSFDGVFIGINDQGDPTIAGKSIEDQIFFSLLSLRLAHYSPSNNSYMTSYLTVSNLITLNFINGYQVASSTDLRFNPSPEHYIRSAAYYVEFLVLTPHISAVFIPQFVVIGSKVPLKVFFNNPLNTTLNISISSGEYLETYTELSNSSSLATDLTFTNDVPNGYQDLTFSLAISKTPIQSLKGSFDFTPNVRIPNGLIYLVGAGILAGLVVLVRRPPEILKKYLDELREETPEASIVDTETNGD